MIAVLHLFDGSADVEDRQTRELLVGQPSDDFESAAIGIGPGGQTRDAFAAAGRVRRLSPDVVHAWGRTALLAAVLGGAKSIVYSPAGSPVEARYLRWISRWCDLHVVHRGEGGRASDGSSVILPAVEPRLKTDVAAARQAVGLAADDIAILAIGESTREADHPSAVWATGILNVLDPRYKIVLWNHGPCASSAVLLADKMRQRAMVTLAPAATPWETLVDAADVALCTASGPVATWPIAVCMAAKLPIVSTVHRTTSRFLTERTARLAADPSPRTLARCVLDVREDPASTAARATDAQRLASEAFSVDRMRAAYGEVYRRLAARPVADRPRMAEFTRELAVGGTKVAHD